MQMILGLLKSVRLYLIGGFLALLIGGLMYLKHSIYQQGYTECQLEHTKQALRKEKNYEKNKQKVRKLDDAALDKLLD